MKKFRLFLTALVIVAVLSLGAPTTSVAAYPDRPIVLIIPFGPGGAADTAARIIAEYFAKKYDINMQIVCKAGGAGAPAMLDVARARPDGYTFGFVSTLPFVTTPQVKKTGYTLDSFEPVVYTAIVYLSIAVNGDSPINTFTELVDDARKNPKKYNFSTHGALSAQRLLMAKLMAEYPDVSIPHIAYSSGHEAATALLGKHVKVNFGVPANHLPYVRSKDFKIIGVSSPERITLFPDAPTFKEQVGKGDEFVLATLQAMIAPKGTPADRIEIIQNLMKKALADPVLIDKLVASGATADYGSSEDLRKHLDEAWVFIGGALETIKFN